MGLGDTHLDLLQNIEMGLKMVFDSDRNLKDAEVIKSLDALIRHYRSLTTGRMPKDVDLPPKEQLVFDSVLQILELREDMIGEEEKPRKRFSRAFTTTSKEGIILACFRKIQNSAKFWTKEHGQQGYLNYISNFL